MTDYIYKVNDVGLRLLCELELAGDYPSWFTDEAVHKYNSHWSRPQTLDDVKKFVESLTSDTSRLIFSVYSIKDEKHIGNISLQSIDHLNQSAEMAFLFGNREYWGKGYAQSASEMVIDHAFKHLNMNRLYLGCLKTNIAMNKLALKLGFVIEGTRRKALFSNGVFHDVVEYGFLKDEVQ